MLNTTPLQNGSIASYCVLFVATLIQFVIAVSYPIRGRSPHLVPGIVAIVAFPLLFTSYALSAADFVATYATDSFGVPLVQFKVLRNLATASLFVSGWANPALFLVIAFVIRDRYLAYDGKKPDGGNSEHSLLSFMIPAYFLALLMLVLSTASTGVFLSATNLSLDAVLAQIAISNRLFYAAVAFYTLAIILLIPFAIVAKHKAQSDTIINVTLFGIIPLLCLRAIAQIVLVVIRARNVTFGSINEDAFALATVTSLGFFYLTVLCILCYFFLSIRLWNGPGDPVPQVPVYPGFQQPFQGGVQPGAQFPGQRGYPASGMQAYQTYPSPQGGGYYPNQLPGQYLVQQPFQPIQPSPLVPAPGPVQT